MQPKPIHFRLSVCPRDENDPIDSTYVDIQCDEADIQSIDTRHGLEDFIEKFVKPGLVYLLDMFQEHYDGASDLTNKMLANGGALPRSIDFYRQKLEMLKANTPHAG